MIFSCSKFIQINMHTLRINKCWWKETKSIKITFLVVGYQHKKLCLKTYPINGHFTTTIYFCRIHSLIVCWQVNPLSKNSLQDTCSSWTNEMTWQFLSNFFHLPIKQRSSWYQRVVFSQAKVNYQFEIHVKKACLLKLVI